MKLNRRNMIFTLLALFTLAGCQVGPDYQKPEVTTAAAFKEAPEGWKEATPQDDALPKDWWTIYYDPILNALEEELTQKNYSVAAARAQMLQAKALMDASAAAYGPTVTTGINESRGSTPLSTLNQQSSSVYNTHNASATLSWETNFWGSTTRAVESARANMEALQANVTATTLLAQSLLAQAYFKVRALDDTQHMLDETAAAYGRLLALTQQRLKAGVASALDVAASENLYQNAQAAASNNTIARQQNEHAIAVLIGKAPADYSLRGPSGVGYVMPQPPQTIPSQLLERRPDIAQAERQVAKANADIGVATAAYYPDLTLGASGGYASHRFAQWITAPMQYWSLGPQLAMTLFDNGAKKARIAAAGAAYEGMVASYKQTVLTAFQEVEDLLATLKSIDEQLKLQWQTTANTHKMWELTRSRQQSGIASQMDVDTAHIALLTAEAACYSLTSQRMATHIQLIKALGGGVYTPSHF